MNRPLSAETIAAADTLLEMRQSVISNCFDELTALERIKGLIVNEENQLQLGKIKQTLEQICSGFEHLRPENQGYMCELWSDYYILDARLDFELGQITLSDAKDAYYRNIDAKKVSLKSPLGPDTDSGRGSSPEC